MNTITLQVKPFDVAAVTKALKVIEGVVGVDVDLAENCAVVTYDEGITDVARLERAVSKVSQRN